MARLLLSPRGMRTASFDEARSRLVELAITLGWTPPGWRDAPYPGRTRLVDRLGDLAFGWLEP